MTTTAEKIEELEQRAERIAKSLEGKQAALYLLQNDIEEIKNQQSQNPDPEPLECWAVTYREGDPTYYTRKHHAEDHLNMCEAGALGLVQMREVTPQDEENAKDAARYRKLKKLESIQPGCIIDHQVNWWDEMIQRRWNPTNGSK